MSRSKTQLICTWIYICDPKQSWKNTAWKSAMSNIHLWVTSWRWWSQWWYWWWWWWLWVHIVTPSVNVPVKHVASWWWWWNTTGGCDQLSDNTNGWQVEASPISPVGNPTPADLGTKPLEAKTIKHSAAEKQTIVNMQQMAVCAIT